MKQKTITRLTESESDASWMKRFRSAVQTWFRRHARELSWRGSRDPYEIWISEIMLQQTTTAAVEGYYGRFLRRFPDVQTLAEAELSEVYRFWEGLGYYRRAAMLHRSADVICRKFHGVFPQHYHDVLSLPGIGRYTAGAILSIALDRRLPILEANTIRLHSRLLALDAEPTSRKGNETLWDFAERILPKRNVGRFNQALMDLGSRVCLAKHPLCYGKCPLLPFCASARENRQSEIPVPKKKTEYTKCTEIAILVERGGKLLLVRYPPGRRWAGLWDFPRISLEGDDVIDVPQCARRFAEITGRHIELRTEILRRRHCVTRYKITTRLHEAIDCGAVKNATVPPHGEKRLPAKWIPVNRLRDIPLNAIVRKIVDELFS